MNRLLRWKWRQECHRYHARWAGAAVKDSPRLSSCNSDRKIYIHESIRRESRIALLSIYIYIVPSLLLWSGRQHSWLWTYPSSSSSSPASSSSSSKRKEKENLGVPFSLWILLLFEKKRKKNEIYCWCCLDFYTIVFFFFVFLDSSILETRFDCHYSSLPRSTIITINVLWEESPSVYCYAFQNCIWRESENGLYHESKWQTIFFSLVAGPSFFSPLTCLGQIDEVHLNLNQHRKSLFPTATSTTPA